MNEIEQKVLKILENINWLIEPHDSYVELIRIKGKKVIIRSTGDCATCEKDCMRVAFNERLPDIKLVIRKGNGHHE